MLYPHSTSNGAEILTIFRPTGRWTDFQQGQLDEVSGIRRADSQLTIVSIHWSLLIWNHLSRRYFKPFLEVIGAWSTLHSDKIHTLHLYHCWSQDLQEKGSRAWGNCEISCLWLQYKDQLFPYSWGQTARPESLAELISRLGSFS